MSALQIVSIGEAGANGDLHLNNENLNNILTKIPDSHKVSVISVVGAFRTGKSFLLNFFLRYLRSSNNNSSINDDTEDSESWMTNEGNSLTEGNLNNAAGSKSVPSFAWRGGQERQTTGIWMWSEPFFRKYGNEKVIFIFIQKNKNSYDVFILGGNTSNGYSRYV